MEHRVVINALQKPMTKVFINFKYTPLNSISQLFLK